MIAEQKMKKKIRVDLPY